MKFLNEKHEIAGWMTATYGATIVGLGWSASWQHVSLILGGAALALGFKVIKAGPFKMRDTDE